MRQFIISQERQPEGRQACKRVDSAGQYPIKNPGMFWYLFACFCLVCWPQSKLNSRSRTPLVIEMKATDFTIDIMFLWDSAIALPLWPLLTLLGCTDPHALPLPWAFTLAVFLSLKYFSSHHTSTWLIPSYA